MEASGDKPTRDQLIEEYQPYVRSVAGQLVKSLGLPVEYFDDFVSAGYIGLVEAAERFNFESGVKFKHFAYLRIRGAIIDGIRQCSDLSGQAYQFAKALRAAEELRAAEAERDRADETPRSREDTIAHILDQAAKGVLAFRLSMSDVQEEVASMQEGGANPEESLEHKEGVRELLSAVSSLPEKERLVVEQYYLQGKSFIEIAEQNEGMSKSWVSRLHTRALQMLKQKYLEQLN